LAAELFTRGNQVLLYARDFTGNGVGILLKRRKFGRGFLPPSIDVRRICFGRELTGQLFGGLFLLASSSL